MGSISSTGSKHEAEQLEKQLEEQKSLHAILQAQIKRQADGRMGRSEG